MFVVSAASNLHLHKLLIGFRVYIVTWLVGSSCKLLYRRCIVDNPAPIADLYFARRAVDRGVDKRSSFDVLGFEGQELCFIRMRRDGDDCRRAHGQNQEKRHRQCYDPR